MKFFLNPNQNLFSAAAVLFAITPVGAFAQSAAAPAAPPAPARARNVSTVVTTSQSGSYVGIYLAEIDGARAKALKLREERGVEVTKVEDDSPAAKAGIKSGDVVLEYNSQRVEGIEQFRRFVRETPPGRDVKVQISRDGNLQNVTVKVGMRKGMEPMVAMAAPRMMEMPEVRVERPGMALGPGMMMWSRTALGIEADAIDGQLAAYFGVKEGVLVRSVVKNTTAEKAGLRAGDVIVKVDDARVATAAELTRAVRTAKSGTKKSFTIVVMRDRKEVTLTAPIDEDERGEWPPAFQFFGRGRRPVSFEVPGGGLTIRL